MYEPGPMSARPVARSECSSAVSIPGSTASKAPGAGALAAGGAEVAGVTVVFENRGSQPLSRFRLRLLHRRAQGTPLHYEAAGLVLTRGGFDVPFDATGRASPVAVTWS